MATADDQPEKQSYLIKYGATDPDQPGQWELSVEEDDSGLYRIRVFDPDGDEVTKPDPSYRMAFDEGIKTVELVLFGLELASDYFWKDADGDEGPPVERIGFPKPSQHPAPYDGGDDG